jgi:hypothetical protein
MALNKDFTFPEKENGLYGNLDYTWDFDNHWPYLTLDYLENETGVNLADKKGNSELAAVELKKVSKLSKIFLMEKLRKDAQYVQEYRVAKDNDLLYEALQYQVQIFEAGFVDGGWLSMYETTDEYGIKSMIGKAAEDYLFMSELRMNNYYNADIDVENFRDGTY